MRRRWSWRAIFRSQHVASPPARKWFLPMAEFLMRSRSGKPSPGGTWRLTSEISGYPHRGHRPLILAIDPPSCRLWTGWSREYWEESSAQVP